MGVLVLETADFLRGSLFETVLHDLHGIDLGGFAHTLVHIVQNGLLVCLKILEELVLVGLVPVQDIVIELYQGDQLSIPFHHQGLIDTSDMVDYLLDFLRLDILTRRTENHIVQPTFNIIASLGIHTCKIIGPEPTVISEN